MKVEEEPFATTWLGEPLAADVMRHNAYVAGWEHGAADHRPSSSFWERLRVLGLMEVYQEGHEDGERARRAAFEKARKVRERARGV